MNNELNELKELVKEFFRILDIKEESDEGRLFSPNYISSCRSMDGVKLDAILRRLKELVKD